MAEKSNVDSFKSNVDIVRPIWDRSHLSIGGRVLWYEKSLATGVPMAGLIFVGHTSGLGLILLPIMLYHPLQLMICTPLAGRWARERDAAELADSIQI